MRSVKRVFKTFGLIFAALASLSLTLSVFLYVVLLKPEWFIHEASVRWASQRILNPMGIDLGFESLTPQFTKDSFFHRTLTIKSRALQLRMKNMELDIPYLSLQLSFDLHPSHLSIQSLGPVDVLNGKLNMRAEAPDPAAEPFTLDQKWIRWLDELQVEPVRISFDEIIFTPYQERPITTKADARLTKSNAERVWSLTLALDKLLVDLHTVQIDLPHAEARVDFSLDDLGVVVRSLGPITVQGEALNVKTSAPTQASQPQNPASPPSQTASKASPRWIEQLKQLRLQPSEITWKTVTIKRPGEPLIEGRVNLSISKPEPQFLKLAMGLSQIKGTPVQSMSLDVGMKIPAGDGYLPLDAEIKGKANLAKLGSASLGGKVLLKSPDDGRYDLDASYRYGSSVFAAKSQGKLKGENFVIDLNGQLTNPHQTLEKIALPRCHLEGAFGEKRRPFLESGLDCVLALTRVPSPAEQPFQDLLPRIAQLKIKGPFTIQAWSDAPQFAAPISITLDPLKSEVYQLVGKTDINLSGILFGPQQSFAGVANIDTRLVIESFQSAVKRFSGTDFTVPAPFNTFEGRLQCAVQGRIRLENKSVYLPVSCASELDSSTQTLWIKADGLVQTRGQQKPLVQMTINLDKVTFQLPRLSLEDPVPQILPDKRIAELTSAALKTESEPLPVELDIKISTPKGRPLQLSSHLMKRPIPIRIDLSLKGDLPTKSGTVGIEDYDVDFLKKRAHIERLKLVLDPAIESPTLDGLLVFKDPDFKIDLKLSGTLAQPFYSFESQPPRSSSELLSMVLFGGSSDSLDEDNLRSVEETRAAMVDGAVGLLSMYYLASTPIDSVGYNPHTGIFRARVRLGKTLSLSVGSDIEGLNQSVGMRKRLTENWSFETTAETDEKTQENKGSAMFRWGRRY